MTRPTGTRPPAPAWKRRGSPWWPVPPGPQRQRTVPQGPVHCGPGHRDRDLPAGQTAVIVPAARGGGTASFRPWCAPARCGRRAPRPNAAAPSPSTRTKPSAAGPGRPARPGLAAALPGGPAVVERKISRYSPAGPGAAARPAARGLARITTDLSPAPERSTGPGSRSSGSVTTQTGWAIPAHMSIRDGKPPLPVYLREPDGHLAVAIGHLRARNADPQPARTPLTSAPS